MRSLRNSHMGIGLNERHHKSDGDIGVGFYLNPPLRSSGAYQKPVSYMLKDGSDDSVIDGY